MNKKIIIGH